MPNAFPFRHRSRLKTASNFTAVYRSGRRRGFGPLVMHMLPNELGRMRLGLSVPRRVGNAVARNRIKRRLREAFRILQHDLPAGYDLVVNVRPHEPLTLAEYQRLMAKALRSLHQTWTKQDTDKPDPRTTAPPSEPSDRRHG